MDYACSATKTNKIFIIADITAKARTVLSLKLITLNSHNYTSRVAILNVRSKVSI